MKKKIIWLVVSCLMVLSLVLVSCGPAAVTEEEEEEEVVTEEEEEEEVVTEEEEEEVVTEGPEMVTITLTKLDGTTMTKTVEKPQYGGTITFRDWRTGHNFEPAIATPVTALAGLTYQTLSLEDWARGPSGTGELSFDDRCFPDEYRVGGLALNWEKPDLVTMIFYLRQDVRWQDVPPVNGRAFVASDVVAAYQHEEEQVRGLFFQKGYTVEALDDYTVKFTLPEPRLGEFERIFTHIWFVPPEVLAAPGGFSDWRNVAGTGPLILEDVVPDVAWTWRRNPDYWQTDPLHPENKLPYADRVVMLIIPDAATAMSAMRSGQLDRMKPVVWTQKDSLTKSNPELLYRRANVGDHQIWPQVTRPPFDDPDVRKALMLSINYEEIVEDYYKGDADPYYSVSNKPAFGPGIFMSYDEMPEDVQHLFSYQPEEARQLLTDAGYPNGFTFTVMSFPDRDFLAVLTLAGSYFEAIGVTMEMSPAEGATFWSITLGKSTDKDAIFGSYSAGNKFSPFAGFFQTDHVWNFTQMNDPVMGDLFTQASAALDEDEQSAILRKMTIRSLETVAMIPIPRAFGYVFWQPWLKGYSGELTYGGYEADTGENYMPWVDQTLKKEMGR